MKLTLAGQRSALHAAAHPGRKPYAVPRGYDEAAGLLALGTALAASVILVLFALPTPL